MARIKISEIRNFFTKCYLRLNETDLNLVIKPIMSLISTLEFKYLYKIFSKERETRQRLKSFHD
jgi:hypothetical protein